MWDVRSYADCVRAMYTWEREKFARSLLDVYSAFVSLPIHPYRASKIVRARLLVSSSFHCR